MSRIVLIHGDAKAAQERVRDLRGAGHTVQLVTRIEPNKLKQLERRPPEMFIIDLTRAPSQGRDLGIWLRGRKSTRTVPLVFAGGAAAKVALIRKLLPDAAYTEWNRIRSAVRSAPRRTVNAVKPGTMAGYSGTPLPKKLGIREGSVVVLLGAPADFEKKLVPLPPEVRLRRRARGHPAHRVLLFVRSRAELQRRSSTATGAVDEGGGLWIVWPKKASGVASDLDQGTVRGFGLKAGWVDHKIGALDEIWSGLCFARRKPGSKK